MRTPFPRRVPVAARGRCFAVIGIAMATSMLAACTAPPRLTEPAGAPSAQSRSAEDSAATGARSAAAPGASTSGASARGRATATPAQKEPASASDASLTSSGGTTGFEQRGPVSLYGQDFAGKQTASGDVFDPQQLTMAHPTLPFGTRVRVTNLENHKSVDVVVNDRGPYVPGRIADLSAAAARRIGMVSDGVVQALLQVLGPAKRP